VRRRRSWLAKPQTRAAAAARAHRESWLNARLAELTEPERATLAQAAALMRRIADYSADDRRPTL
jgi:hypothetical protein